MPQGDKSGYTDKQKRQAAHIEAGYEKKGLSTKSAEARAWATLAGVAQEVETTIVKIMKEAAISTHSKSKP